MKRTSKFCTSENYFCKCVKCRLAIKTAQELDFRQVEKELRNQRQNEIAHNGGKLSSELLKEIL